MKDVSPEEKGGTPERRCREIGGGTLFRAKETSFFCSKKEENEIFIIFQFERYLLGIANYQK